MMNDKIKTSAILVLGMHRSGTSAITGVMHLLGIKLGSNLIPAEQDINPKGFWEDALISATNEEILESLGSHWFDARSLPPQWWLSGELEPLRKRLHAFVEEQFGHETSCWILKDPRLCRLLPLWAPLLQKLNFSPEVLLILRHPSEVADSLLKRDGIQLPHALLLWMRYVLESEKDSRNLTRVVITYNDLLQDWQGTIQTIRDKLALDITVTDAARASVDAFLEKDLKHHTAIAANDDKLMNLAVRLYDHIRLGDTVGLELFERELENWITETASWHLEVNQLLYERGKYKVDSQRVTNLEQEIDRLKSTYSWRITGPLRVMWNICRNSSKKT